jgi:hypothetical protein
MKKNMYSIYDRKSNSYAAPFIELTDGTAIRAIQDVMNNNANHQFVRYADDFQLVRVGMFDEDAGILIDDLRGEVIELNQLKDGE